MFRQPRLVMKKSGIDAEVGGDFVTRSIFGLTEIIGKFKAANPTQIARKLNDQRKSTAEMSEIIKKEYANIFWVTGEMDLSLWEDNCTFSDPFSSFGGSGSTLRFKRNADALGSLVVNATIKLTSLDIVTNKDKGDVVKIGWIFSSFLNFPWKPILGAAGETSHYLSPVSGKIYKYEERWKSEPWDVVKRLFVPSKRTKKY